MRGPSDYSARSDKDLVIAFKQGDRRAYDELYRRHQQRVRGVCFRMLKDPADVDEAVQETFLKSFQALGRFNGQYQVGAWLARIATNVCLDQLRARSRGFEKVELQETDEDLTYATERPEVLVTDQIHLSEALAEIQPLHTHALMLRAVEGMSHAEMAGELDITPKQAKSLLHRARISFKRAWQHASGFALAPIATMRSLANRSRDPNIQGMAVASPASALTLERFATGAVAAVLVVTGLGGSPNAPAPAEPAEEKAARPTIAARPHAAKNTGTARVTQQQETRGHHQGNDEARLQKLVASLGQKIKGQVNTHNTPAPDDSSGDVQPVPTGSNDEVNDTGKRIEKAKKKISQSLEDLQP